MNMLDKRLDKLAEPEMLPVNPLALAALEFAAAHPDHARILTVMAEANRTGRLPTDPLVLALVRVVDASNAADKAGLFQSTFGERHYQTTDAQVAHYCDLAALDENAAQAIQAIERIMREVLADFVRKHLPALTERAAQRSLDEAKGIADDGN